MNNKIAALVTTTTFGLICSISTTQSAQAATFTYNLGGDNADRSSFVFTPEGFAEPVLTVTAAEFVNSQNERRDVRRRSDGLGVIGENDNQPGQVDGRNGLNEALVLNFEQPVTIDSAAFSRLQPNDGFRLVVDGNRLVNKRNNLDNPFNFSDFPVSDRTGSRFRFTVSQNNDDYRLQSIVISTSVPETSAILPLLSLGLIGLLSYSKTSNF